MNRTILHNVADRAWQIWAVGALVGFFVWSIFLIEVLRECYHPQYTHMQADAASQGGAGTAAGAAPGRWQRVVALLVEDQSGASAICVGLLLLALAKFGYLRWHLNLHWQLVNNSGGNTRAPAYLGEGDPLVHYLSTGRKAADLEWLERRLAPLYDLHRLAGPCITLGLLGTLVGLWIGFVNTLGPTAALTGEGASLQRALSGSVVVVATAALSSIVGIGIGQWIIESLADGIDHDVEKLINELREDSSSRTRA